MNKRKSDYKIIETTKNVYAFLYNSRLRLGKVLYYYAPFMFGAFTFDILLKLFSNNPFPTISLLMSIIVYSLCAISWHRITLLGEKNTEFISPFKPSKSDFKFIGAYLFVVLLTMLSLGILYVAALILETPIFGISKNTFTTIALSVSGFISAIFVMSYVPFRFSLYFPGQAIGSQRKLFDAFKLTKGYFLKFAGVCFLVLAPIYTISSLYAFLSNVLIAEFISKEVLENPRLKFSIELLQELPNSAVFMPIAAMFGASILSDFYAHVLKEEKYKRLGRRS